MALLIIERLATWRKPSCDIHKLLLSFRCPKLIGETLPALLEMVGMDMGLGVKAIFRPCNFPSH